ncbi:hypothetical protein [Tabrizicola sp. BL-A-41-H6]|uniref:hypothetical protein n=1 Tax=Tabrizicola sp. BL-A-41-H6 TaxID=3421107 RepID=UPI003D673E74
MQHPVTFVHLAGNRNLIAARMAEGKWRYMPLSLLDSQFAALEPPDAGKGIAVDVGPSGPAITDAVVAALGLAG